MSQNVTKSTTIKQMTPFEHLVKNRLTVFELKNLHNVLGLSPKMLTIYFNEPMKMPLDIFFTFGKLLDKSLDELKPMTTTKLNSND